MSTQRYIQGCSQQFTYNKQKLKTTKMSSTTDWVNKYNYIMEYYPTIKQNKLLIGTTMWKNCTNMMKRGKAKHKST